MKSSLNNQCLVCGAGLSLMGKRYCDTRFGIPTFYEMGLCTSCGLVQIGPPPAADDLQKLYKNFYNFEGRDNPSYQKRRSLFLKSFLYRLWIAIDGDISFHTRQGNGRLLDFGCNEGRSLFFYRKNGFFVEGLETNTVAAQAARNEGWTVHTEDVGDFVAAQKFDVVVLSNVLEHFLDPIVKLAQIKKTLTPKGQLWISCPNYKSWLQPLFGRFWINWHVPFHIVQFDADTITSTLAKSGYSIKEMKTKTPSLWVAHSILAALFSKPGKSTHVLRSPVILAGLMMCIRGVLFPFLWLGNLLGKGDCLVLIAEAN